MRAHTAQLLLALASGALCGTASLAGCSGTETHAGAGGSGASIPPECQPILSETRLDTGFDKCVDGTKRRRAALQCPAAPTTTTDECTHSPGAQYNCTKDSECNENPNGWCASAHHASGYCGCYYGCTRDADCGAGSICECGYPLGVCVAATCATNADCGLGLGCVGTPDTHSLSYPAHAGAGSQPEECYDRIGSGPNEYACQTAADACRSQNDCGCVLVGDHRVCYPRCPI